MTAVEISFRYGRVPGTHEMTAIDSFREVYGIRRVQFNEAEHTIRVEYDATRLNENTVAALLKRAGLDVLERLALA
ncbi:MAG TPA: hypothetical protein VKW78_01770 [Terriglobales bacterium]|nr:hypothetical protein [Terriglobales bacterium]